MHPYNIDVIYGELTDEQFDLYSKYQEEHPIPEPPKGGYTTDPFDDYEQLRDLLMECVPDFRLRLKVSPRTERMVFSVDVESLLTLLGSPLPA